MTTSLRPTCPHCGSSASGGELQRVPRHFADRLLSLLRLQHRYQCRRIDCGWEGTLPVVARSPLRGGQVVRPAH